MHYITFSLSCAQRRQAVNLAESTKNNYFMQFLKANIKFQEILDISLSTYFSLEDKAFTDSSQAEVHCGSELILPQYELHYYQ